MLPRPKDVTFVTRSTWHTCPLDPPPHWCGAACGSLCALQPWQCARMCFVLFLNIHTKRFERWGRLFNGRFLISSSRQRVESKISRARFLYICVFFFSVGTLGLLPHYSVYKEMHTLTTQGLDAHSHDLRLHHFAFCSLFFWTRKMSALWRWDGDMGWAKRPGGFFRGLSTSLRIRINHEFSVMPNVLWAEYNF